MLADVAAVAVTLDEKKPSGLTFLVWEICCGLEPLFSLTTKKTTATAVINNNNNNKISILTSTTDYSKYKVSIQCSKIKATNDAN